MSAEESLVNRMEKAREAVRAHMECSMPQRRAEWADEMKRRRLSPKPARKRPAPTLAPPCGMEGSILQAASAELSLEREKPQVPKISMEEEGIESYWFGDK